MSTNPTESRVRRALAKSGRRLVKVHPASRWAAEYGPYYVVDDDTNGVLGRALDLDEALSLAAE